MQSKEELMQLLTQAHPNTPETELAKWVKVLTQLKGCHVHSLAAQGEDDEGWHAARAKGIGGSEIAAICGKSSWSSPHDIYLKKVPQFANEPAQPQSEAARWGNVLEDSIIKEWSHRTGRGYIHLPVSLQKDDNPIFIANVDGFEVDEDLNVLGILECKTTTLHNINAWSEGEVPIYYMYQIQWYMMITGLTTTCIMCLVGGQKLFYYDFPFVKPIADEEASAAVTFWNNNVLPQVPPALTDVDAERLQEEKAKQIEDVPPIISEDEESISTLEQYVEVRTQIGSLKKIQDALKAKIFESMGKANELLAGERLARCTKSTRRTCNMDLLESKYPDIYDEVVTATVSVRLSVK